MSTARRLHYSYEDYLRTLEMSPFKLEYCEGVIYAMAGGTPTHAALSAAMIYRLSEALGGRCTVYSADLKVRVDASDLSTFPDATIVCGPLRPSPVDAHAATNPSVVVEVTSPSTEDYDRGAKLAYYQELAACRAVLLVSHRERRITVVERTPTGWSEREARAGETVKLGEPALELEVDAVYAGIALDAA